MAACMGDQDSERETETKKHIFANNFIFLLFFFFFLYLLGDLNWSKRQSINKQMTNPVQWTNLHVDIFLFTFTWSMSDALKQFDKYFDHEMNPNHSLLATLNYDKCDFANKMCANHTLRILFLFFNRLVFHWSTQITLASSYFIKRNKKRFSHETEKIDLTGVWPQYKDKSCRNEINSIRSIDDSNNCCMH